MICNFMMKSFDYQTVQYMNLMTHVRYSEIHVCAADSSCFGSGPHQDGFGDQRAGVQNYICLCQCLFSFDGETFIPLPVKFADSRPVSGLAVNSTHCPQLRLHVPDSELLSCLSLERFIGGEHSGCHRLFSRLPTACFLDSGPPPGREFLRKQTARLAVALSTGLGACPLRLE